MPISPAHFRHVLAGILDRAGKAPLALEVNRTPGEVVQVTWTDAEGEDGHLSLAEWQVIEKGGPVWVADLVMAKPSKRRQMLGVETR